MGVFKNEKVLSPEYLPSSLPHREGQIEEIAKNMYPATKLRRPQNTFIHGPPGIGKTACAKYVIGKMKSFSVIPVYLNCWDYKTSVSLFAKLGSNLGGFVKRRGVSKDEIMERTFEMMNKRRKSIVICLDEVDQLIFHDRSSLYDLVRINEYVDVPVGLIFISNNKYVFSELDERIKSSLDVEEIEFRPYSLLEMKDILSERAKEAFFSIESGAVALAANHAFKNGGDVRIGLECLRKAGRLAEDKGRKVVTTSDMKIVIKEVGNIKREIIKERLNLDEKIILKILEEKGRVSTSELYKEYKNRIEFPVTKRRFRDFVRHLSELSFVRVLDMRRGIRGMRRIVEFVDK